MWLRFLPAKYSNWWLASRYSKSCRRHWTGSWMWAELACHQHCNLHWPQIWTHTKALKPPQKFWRRSSSPSSKLLYSKSKLQMIVVNNHKNVLKSYACRKSSMFAAFVLLGHSCCQLLGPQTTTGFCFGLYWELTLKKLTLSRLCFTFSFHRQW